MHAYVYAAVMGNWSDFAKAFGVQAPANGCLDYCAADLPFTAWLDWNSLFPDRAGAGIPLLAETFQ